VDASWVGGHSVAIVGANGSGKSTLLKILAGLLTPWKGEVSLRIEGNEVPAEARPFHVGMVAPYLQVYDGFSPRENLEFLFKARGLRGNARQRADALVSLVGLAERADDHVATFSSGMKQRVRLAAALIADPPVLLLDEPTTNLDEKGRSVVEAISTAHLDRGGLLLVATNEASEAARHPFRLDVEEFRV
jgi:heme exporter protein A